MPLANKTYLALLIGLALIVANPANAIQQSGESQQQSLTKIQQQALEHAMHGQKLYKEKKAAQAVEELKKAVQLQPNNAEYRNQLATAHYHNNDMKQMWIELRKGAMIDPSHKLVAQGLVTYWNMMDKQGLFNVGSPAATVAQVLGTPDNATTHKQNPAKTRKVYGFLAADFIDGKLHETLDLRGLRPEHFVPQETISVSFDGRGWKPAYRVNNRNVATAEWTLPNERIQQWTELVSIQRMHNRSETAPGIEMVAIGMMDSLKKSTPDRQYRIIEKDENSVLFEWKTAGNEKSAAQHEIVRLFKAPRDIHRIAYVKKTESLDEAARDRWVNILRAAKLQPVGDAKSPTASTQKSANGIVTDKQMWVFGRFLSVAVFAHARKQEELAKQNLVQAFRLSEQIGVQLPKPFELTDDEMENISRAVDYLVNQTPNSMRTASIAKDKIATYQLITRTFVLAMLAADEGLVEKSMTMIRKAATESQLPNALIAALEERTAAGATPDQIRGIIRKLHADAEIYLNRSQPAAQTAKQPEQPIKASQTRTTSKPVGKTIPVMAGKVDLSSGKRVEISTDGRVWIDSNRVGALTADGEVWVNGNKEGELTARGEVWKAGNKVGTITDSGEIWLSGDKIGSIESNGSIWMNGSNIGSLSGQNRKGMALVVFYGFFDVN